MRFRPASLLALSFALSGCGASSLAKLAADGRTEELGKEIASRKKPLEKSELREISRKTLARALARAEGKTGEALLDDLAGCSSELESELRERSERKDDVGYAAKLVLVENGRESLCAARNFATDDSPGARSLIARTLTGSDDGEARRKALLDPEARVRRAALFAARVARDEKDLDSLLEVARLDPEPDLRSIAFQTLAVLGGERLAARLYDRYASASEPERLNILDAWASEKTFESGGEDHLLRVLNSGPESGYLRLEAAYRLSNSRSAERERAETLLVNVLRDGTTGERIFAVTHVKLDSPETRKVLVSLLESENKTVAVVAAARLVSREETRAKGRAFLEIFAREDSELGRRARAALSVTGKAPSPEVLRRDLTSTDPTTRLSAGRALLRTTEFAASASLLADADPAVSVAHSCATLERLSR